MVFIGGLVEDPLQDLREKFLLSALIFEELVVAVLEDEGVLLLRLRQLIESLHLLLWLDHILGTVKHKKRVCKLMGVLKDLLTELIVFLDHFD